jgi:hypothetical protein
MNPVVCYDWQSGAIASRKMYNGIRKTVINFLNIIIGGRRPQPVPLEAALLRKRLKIHDTMLISDKIIKTSAGAPSERSASCF